MDYLQAGFILKRILRWRMLSFILFLFIVIYPLVFWEKLPTQYAWRFSLNGTPVGHVNKAIAYSVFVYLGLVLLVPNLFVDVRTIKCLWRDSKNAARWYFYLPLSDVFLAFAAYIVYITLQFNINQPQPFSFEIWKFFLFLALPVGVISLLNSRLKSGQGESYCAKERIVKDWGKCLYRDKQVLYYVRITCFIVILGFGFLLFFSSDKVGIVLVAVIPLAMFIVSHMDFLIYERAIVIKIGMPKLYKKVILMDTIKEVHPESFKPIQDFGGWGIRQRGDGTHGYFMRGNRGLFIMTDTSKWLLGFNNPEEAEQIVKKQLGITVK